MNAKRAFYWICIFGKWIGRIWKFYQNSRIEQEEKDKFITRCEKARAYAEDKLKITVEYSERIGDFYYLTGTYPNGSPYKLKMQKGK